MASVARRTGWPVSTKQVEPVVAKMEPKNGTTLANIAPLTINRTIHL
jgi:hypothetical protein